jgi:hypothetical protein
MKKLTVLIAAMVMTASASMAQHQNAYAKNGQVYTQDYSRYETSHRSSRGTMMNINSFQRQARERIADGIVEGTITSHEAKRLLEFAERIEIKENRYLRNGRLTTNESRELKEDLNDLNRMIIRDIRDGDRAPVDVNNHRKGAPVYKKH